jgi:formylglycine-generating enzyme required for sulfatase activity
VAVQTAGAGQGVNRVNRGGSWSNNAANCRAANRNRNNPDNRNNNLGFRPAPAPPAPDQMIQSDGTGQ